MLYIPDLDTNLPSVSAFAKNGLRSYFGASSCILLDKDGTFEYGDSGRACIRSMPLQ